MPGYKIDQLIQANSFGPKQSRQKASSVRNYLRKAAESLARKPETEALSKELLEYEQAIRNVSIAPRQLDREKGRASSAG